MGVPPNNRWLMGMFMIEVSALLFHFDPFPSLDSAGTFQKRQEPSMSDLKIDPEDGLAVQDLSTLDVSWQKKTGWSQNGLSG